MSLKRLDSPTRTEACWNIFSVRLEKGSLTAVAGSSGAGKSTMMKLLLGLLQCEEGQIYFDLGKKKIPADAGTRKMFAYVPQEYDLIRNHP